MIPFPLSCNEGHARYLGPLVEREERLDDHVVGAPGAIEMGFIPVELWLGLWATKTEADGDEVERPRRFLRIIGEDGGSNGQDVVFALWSRLRKDALLVQTTFTRREEDVLLFDLLLIRKVWRLLPGPIPMRLDADVVLPEAHAFPIGQAHQINSNGDVAVIFRELRRAVRVDDPVLQAIRHKAVIDRGAATNRRIARKRGWPADKLVAPDDVCDFGEPVVVRAVLA